MKKLLLSTGLFFFYIFNLQAQEDNDFIKNRTTFGVKGGLNFSYFSSVGHEDFTGYDFYGGLFSETRFNKKWSFQNEVIYSNNLYYRFIEAPLLIKYHINKKWSVFAGPSLNFSIDDRNIENSTVGSLGLSVVIGTQYNISDNFFIEGRFNLGLTNQIDKIENNIKNSYSRNLFRIGIGYRF